MKKMANEHFPEVEVVRGTLHNLSTYSLAAFYEVFPAEEARRIVRRLDFHSVPAHESWLNMAEIELFMLVRQCLGERIPQPNLVQEKVEVWVKERNRKKATVQWHFI